ncbi:MAG: ribosomal-processing cysteine protease Prp [Lachnospiraceae bacterium]|nr:ribosomal-processing cysteine protease Prp [Lachnospiraceae bacterium]
MTTVVVYKNRTGSYRGFTCMGHAGYAVKGPDILCSSISILVLNTINALEELAGEQFETVSNEETGFIKCDFQGNLQEKSIFLLDAMVYGLEDLSRTYGQKYLQVNFKEV